MRESRVAICDDWPSIRQLARFLLSESNRHHFVAEASNREEAVLLPAKLAMGEVDFNVVLLDGDMGSGLSDARAFITALYKHGVRDRVTVVGTAARDLREYGIDVDADPGKDMLAQDCLLEFLDELQPRGHSPSAA